MAIQVYRDVAAADGAAAVAELAHRLTQLSNGFTFLAYGNGAARSTIYPGSAALLAAQLRAAPSSWVAWQRGSRTWSLQRATTANPDYTAWRYEYTATGTPVAGTGTSPDRITPTATSGSQYVSGAFFRTLAPVTGSVVEAMKCHILVDDATASFALITRRTPFPSGNFGFFSAVFCDQLTSPIWAANPDPIVLGIPAANSNTGDAQLIVSNYNAAWRAFGTGAASWLSGSPLLENPSTLAGSTTIDAGGQDVMFPARWGYGPSTPGIIGTSSLFSLIQPGRTPVLGLNTTTPRSHAAFWTVAVPNDGTALTP